MHLSERRPQFEQCGRPESHRIFRNRLPRRRSVNQAHPKKPMDEGDSPLLARDDRRGRCPPRWLARRRRLPLLPRWGRTFIRRAGGVVTQLVHLSILRLLLDRLRLALALRLALGLGLRCVRGRAGPVDRHRIYTRDVLRHAVPLGRLAAVHGGGSTRLVEEGDVADLGQRLFVGRYRPSVKSV
ncbi:unnamed protein product [Mycena citricolor]|uniref:Uncharacterized protein n=1 Tax=Mycena citricolor TaxID=2018698 RepID=A0AAD2HWK7_9AGAR|nr:unnamed protein product [Mycena citricolor]